MFWENDNEINIAKALLEELINLNKQIIVSSKLAESIRNSNSFLYGFNPHGKTEDPASYKKHASFMNAISESLNGFDICIKNNGYAFMTEAVKVIIDLNRIDLKLSNDVYPHIMCKYKLKSVSTVEHNIRNAINSAYKRCHEQGKSNRMLCFEKRPTNKEFLIMLSNEVRIKMCNELLDSNC